MITRSENTTSVKDVVLCQTTPKTLLSSVLGYNFGALFCNPHMTNKYNSAILKFSSYSENSLENFDNVIIRIAVTCRDMACQTAGQRWAMLVSLCLTWMTHQFHNSQRKRLGTIHMTDHFQKNTHFLSKAGPSPEEWQNFNRFKRN